MSGTSLFSGEPLPVAPRVNQPEVAAFHRKLLDYLRRLTGKLEQYIDVTGGGGGGTGTTGVPTIALWLSSDTGLETSYTAVNFDKKLWLDSTEYTYTSGRITVVKKGLYLIEFDLETSAVGGDVVEAVVQVLNPDNTVQFTVSFGYTTVDTTTTSMAVPIALPAGKTFQVSVRTSGAGDFTGIKKRGTRLTVLQLHADVYDGGGGGDGWDAADDSSIPTWGIAEL